MFDLIIIGAGPAGLTAALYAARAEKNVLILEKNTVGGQIVNSPVVENIPGTDSISGKNFIKALKAQVLSYGVRLEMEEALGIRSEGETKVVSTNKGEYEGRCVIIAAGAQPKRLNVPGEEEFLGNGVSYCAICDGAHYKKKKVAVVGGGNSALLEALQLCEYCSKVTIIQDLDRLTGEEHWIKALQRHKNVEVMYHTVVDSIERSGALTVHLVNTETNAPKAIHVDGLFVAIGQEPANQAFDGIADLDRAGYLMSDEDCLTKEEGVFVAGDCRTKRIRQITTATADGTVAAMAAVQYLGTL